MSSNKGKVLVTGGAGLVGSHLVDLLLQKGYAVTILDNLEPQTHLKGQPDWIPPEAHFIHGDVTNEKNVERALEGVRLVFHQAAFGGFTTAVSKYIDVNVVGTAKLFERLALGKHTVEKVVVASSQANYGEGAYRHPEHGIVYPAPRSMHQLKQKKWEHQSKDGCLDLEPAPTPENAPLTNTTPYALSKEYEERLSLALGLQNKIPVVALRYAVTYGPRQSIFNPYTGVVSVFSTRILNNLPPLIYEDGQQTRDFIYAGDVARANLFVMENPHTDYQVFNVSTGIATKVSDLARELSRLYGKSIEPQMTHQYRLGDVRHLCPDPGKLAAMGFEAEKSLRDGLKLFSAWISQYGDVREYFSEAYDNLKRNRLIYD